MNFNPKSNPFVFFLPFGAFIYFIIFFFANNPRFYIEDIKSEFKGYLSHKYFSKADHYVFRIENNQTLDVGPLAHPLTEIIEDGDSIIKYKNDNHCKIIKPDGRVFKTAYIFVPEDCRTDFRWPNEWKNKPKEWYGE